MTGQEPSDSESHAPAPIESPIARRWWAETVRPGTSRGCAQPPWNPPTSSGETSAAGPSTDAADAPCSASTTRTRLIRPAPSGGSERVSSVVPGSSVVPSAA